MKQDIKIITIKDLAKKAGVSVGTVSNVINGLGSVKKDNKIKVLDAMKELKYIPNLTAKSLKTNKTNTIGLIVPTIDNPFYPAVAKGVEDFANSKGYTILLCNSDRKYEKEVQYMDMLLSKRVAGIILIKSRLNDYKIKEYKNQVQLVFVDYLNTQSIDIDTIKVDNYGGSLKAMDHLFSLGHRDIAFILGDMTAKSGKDRYKGYVDFLEKNNIAIKKEYINDGSFSWNGGYDSTIKLLNLKDPPTAIFCANDLMALGAMKAIRSKGLSIPDDISIVGFDDIDMCELTTPTLTTIKHPKYEQGEACARLLFEKLENTEEEDESFIHDDFYNIKTELIIRESTGKLK